MVKKTEQRLVVLEVDPHAGVDLTPDLQKLELWGEGWTIQQVSLSSFGKDNSRLAAAVVLTREGEKKSVRATWP